jgi:hypothetical protein
VLVSFLLVGVGGGLVGAPLMTVALSEVPAADAGLLVAMPVLRPARAAAA